MKHDLIVIVGPTAVGKTKLSIELAKAFNGEIINGDAFQVYRGMDIGTAKITPEEMEGIPHHLLDIVDPGDTYTVSDFQRDARRQIQAIHQRGKLPILVGGTGLYINAVLYKNYTFQDEPHNPAFRKELERFAAEHGSKALYQRLLETDRHAAKSIHPNNVKRVIRAIEKARNPSLEPEAEKVKEPLYRHLVIGLSMNRDELYARINHRVELMMAQGLMKEVESLAEQQLQNSQAAQAIGYKELFPVFSGHYDQAEAVRLIKRNSRRFAKRQMTWFKHQMQVHWFSMDQVEQTFTKKVTKIMEFVAGKMN
ncbi:tRNA dimethylallyltransferase [Pullulanibacillus camelliae]|uniref:tRNA dimethylallyltransferase n=1 Tax=Pullulanibacillus camelliae TaxID=1707096 RepID=A0A8J2YJ06_9BACL|nr:tRNA (adenosine(37)-N6)-dimethylallyltransferase MiaA [Pullulanibacillus camelliae]GGE45769.1 tRNA dimethylallyltransferase [Pullulanibacillus camelliae]